MQSRSFEPKSRFVMLVVVEISSVNFGFKINLFLRIFFVDFIEFRNLTIRGGCSLNLQLNFEFVSWVIYGQ